MTKVLPIGAVLICASWSSMSSIWSELDWTSPERSSNWSECSCKFSMMLEMFWVMTSFNHFTSAFNAWFSAKTSSTVLKRNSSLPSANNQSFSVSLWKAICWSWSLAFQDCWDQESMKTAERLKVMWNFSWRNPFHSDMKCSSVLPVAFLSWTELVSNAQWLTPMIVDFQKSSPKRACLRKVQNLIINFQGSEELTCISLSICWKAESNLSFSPLINNTMEFAPTISSVRTSIISSMSLSSSSSESPNPGVSTIVKASP